MPESQKILHNKSRKIRKYAPFIAQTLFRILAQKDSMYKAVTSRYYYEWPC